MPDDLEKLLRTITSGDAATAKVIDRTVVERPDGWVIVSTVVTPDMGPETAVIDGAVTAHTKPVERYATEDEARAGHAKWCAAVRTLATLTMLPYGELPGTGGEFPVVSLTTKPE